MMRASSYVIKVALPDDERLLLIHGYSGAVDLVDPKVAHYLERMQGGDPSALSDSSLTEETLVRLRQRGYLTDKTAEEEEQFVCRLGEIILKRRLSQLRTNFLIIPSYKCQLRCIYCYERGLYARGKTWMGQVMDREMADAAFVAMEKIQPDRQRVGRITLYGGEPLLAEHVGIVQYIVDQGVAKGCRFFAVTNGVDLDRYLDLLGPGRIETIQITLDGPPAVHDRLRRDAKGEGTFATIARNISRALKTGVRIGVRTNVDRTNIEAVGQLAAIYQEQGWTAYKNFRAYARVIHHQWHTSERHCLSKQEMVDIIATIGQAHPGVKDVIKTDHGIPRSFEGLLESKEFPLLRPVFCGSSFKNYLFDPFGDVYVCWEGCGNPEIGVGRYVPKLSLDEEKLDLWRKRTIMNIPECRKCAYALLCGGGCPMHAYLDHGHLLSPSCSEFKELFHKLVPEAYSRWEAFQEAKREETGDDRGENRLLKGKDSRR